MVEEHFDWLSDYRVGEQSARSGIAPYNFIVRRGSRKKEKDKGQKASTPCDPASGGHMPPACYMHQSRLRKFISGNCLR